jgi:hypothetical protein
VAAAAGCNQVFDIDETHPAADSFDLDADTIEDDVDNCAEVPNTDQLDGDVDEIGDACDLCPTTASENQHDEDHDGIGDACEVCPALPDFGDDTDGDKVGDLCERDSRISMRTLFDPFVALHPGLVPGVVGWVAADDEVAPVTMLPPTDAGLRLAGVSLGSNWAVRTYTRSQTRWVEGEFFGVRVRDLTTGQIEASCLVFCDGASCTSSLSSGIDSTVATSTPAAIPEVEVSLFQTFDPQAGKLLYACLMRPLPTLKMEVGGFPPAAVVPELLGSPNVHLKSVDIIQ